MVPGQYHRSSPGHVARATWAGKCLTGRDWENDFEAGQRLIEARLKKIMSSEEGRAKLAADAQRDFDRRTLAKATAVTQQLGSQSGLLANPIALTNDFFRHAKSQSIFVCGLFNAMGPTWNIVSLVSVGSEDGFLLCHRMLNPFQQVNHAWGRFKDGTGRAAKDVCDAVIELFRRNGSATAPMLASMPSWFLGHAFDDHYEHLGAEALAAFALQHQPDLQSEIELYQRVTNPWERASQAVESAMAGLDARKTKPHSLPKAGPRKVDEALISKWMEVVTSEEHLLPEIIGMAQASVGCLEYQRKHGNAELADAALSFADLDAYLKSLKFDLFDKIDWQSAGQS